jgi:acyl-CoA thioesterase
VSEPKGAADAWTEEPVFGDEGRRQLKAPEGERTISTAFDEDTYVSPDGELTLSGRWNGIADVANGGYMMAICLRALAARMPFPDPLVVSGFFLRPGVPGPAQVRTSLLRAGRTTAYGEATLSCSGKDTVRTTAAFTKLTTGQNGPLFHGAAPPELPPPGECATMPGTSPLGIPAIAGRVDFRIPELPGWITGSPSGRPSAEFWLRFADGREADLISLPLLADAAPPVALDLGAVSTTVELTVYLRAHPAPGWLACRASTRFVSGGYHEEDFEVWDSAGTLCAQSRQLCLIY